MNINEKERLNKIRITFHQVDHSDALEQHIWNKANKLLRAHSLIQSCHVIVDSPHKHKHKGNLFQVRIDIRLPKREVVVNKQPGIKLHPHQDPYVAVADAFKAAEHLLQRDKEKARDMVKHHEPPLHGRISKLLEDGGYIESPNFTQIYFHQNSLEAGKNFHDLKIGETVHFVLSENGQKELAASFVKPLSSHPLINDIHALKDIAQKEI